MITNNSEAHSQQATMHAMSTGTRPMDSAHFVANFLTQALLLVAAVICNRDQGRAAVRVTIRTGNRTHAPSSGQSSAAASRLRTTISDESEQRGRQPSGMIRHDGSPAISPCRRVSSIIRWLTSSNRCSSAEPKQAGGGVRRLRNNDESARTEHFVAGADGGEVARVVGSLLLVALAHKGLELGEHLVRLGARLVQRLTRLRLLLLRLADQLGVARRSNGLTTDGNRHFTERTGTNGWTDVPHRWRPCALPLPLAAIATA